MTVASYLTIILQNKDLVKSIVDVLIFCKNNYTESIEPSELSETDRTHNMTSMFLNKYCEDIDMPTVANRVADMIVDFEMNKRWRITVLEDVSLNPSWGPGHKMPIPLS